MKILHKEIARCLDCPFAYFGDMINDNKHFICRATSKKQDIMRITLPPPERCPLPDAQEKNSCGKEESSADAEKQNIIHPEKLEAFLKTPQGKRRLQELVSHSKP